MIYLILPLAKFASKGLRQDKCMLGGIAMRRIFQVYLAEIVKWLKWRHYKQCNLLWTSMFYNKKVMLEGKNLNSI